MRIRIVSVSMPIEDQTTCASLRPRGPANQPARNCGIGDRDIVRFGDSARMRIDAGLEPMDVAVGIIEAIDLALRYQEVSLVNFIARVSLADVICSVTIWDPCILLEGQLAQPFRPGGVDDVDLRLARPALERLHLIVVLHAART